MFASLFGRNFVKVWSLLSRSERWAAIWVLCVAIIAAVLSTAMVASVVPFLTIVADPAKVKELWFLSSLYDYFGFQSAYAFTLAVGFASLAMIMLGMFAQYLRVYTTSRFVMMRIHSLSSRLIANYMGKPYAFFLNRHSGEMGNRVLSEAQEVVLRFILPATEFITSLTAIAALVGYLIWVQPVISLVAFALLGGTFGISFAATRATMRRLGHLRATRNADRFKLAGEAFSGVKDLKLLGREPIYVDRFSAASHELATAESRFRIISELPFYFVQTVALAGVIVFCLLLLQRDSVASEGELAKLLPLLGLFGFAGQRLLPEISRIYRSATKLQFAKGAIDLVYADLADSNAKDALLRVLPPALGMKATLELAGINYNYPSSETAGIRDISLTIRAGEKIGIVGETGAGKTTLVDIILGLLTPRSGTILVDGVQVTESNVRAWQQTVGYVQQNIFLVDATVSENIAFGLSPGEIDEAKKIAAAKAAKIHTFVTEQLPGGYDTIVGERGVRLSGGQRQRIGIARALYHDADLIVLDEATSALDNITEKEVMAAIDDLDGRKTALIIAHRLSTVRNCDRIIVMEKGSILAFDRWDVLMASNPVFQRIAKSG